MTLRPVPCPRLSVALVYFTLACSLHQIDSCKSVQSWLGNIRLRIFERPRYLRDNAKQLQISLGLPGRTLPDASLDYGEKIYLMPPEIAHCCCLPVIPSRVFICHAGNLLLGLFMMRPSIRPPLFQLLMLVTSRVRHPLENVCNRRSSLCIVLSEPLHEIPVRCHSPSFTELFAILRRFDIETLVYPGALQCSLGRRTTSPQLWSYSSWWIVGL